MPTVAKRHQDRLPLSSLRNVGKAALADFELLAITTVAELAKQDPDALYLRLGQLTGQRQVPCVRDVFAATIHEAKTGEKLDWWAFTPERKARQAKNVTAESFDTVAPR
jgi:nucleotidyltransferase/DNA polymerase involved in DNA repair